MDTLYVYRLMMNIDSIDKLPSIPELQEQFKQVANYEKEEVEAVSKLLQFYFFSILHGSEHGCWDFRCVFSDSRVLIKYTKLFGMKLYGFIGMEPASGDLLYFGNTWLGKIAREFPDIFCDLPGSCFSLHDAWIKAELECKL